MISIPLISTLARLVPLMVLLIPATQAMADTAADKGREVALKMDQRDRGFGDFRANVEMVLLDQSGQQRKLQMDINVLEQQDPLEKTLIRFSSPHAIDGTAVLTYANRSREDDQWLFLPSVKRSKRISSANRSGAFVGSDFSYEDLVRQDLEKYSYRLIEQKPCGTLTCAVVERVPKNTTSGYSRQLLWVDTQYHRPMRIEFFDRGSKLLKTLNYSDYQVYLKDFWRPGTMQMQNHQNGHSTVLTWRDYRFRNGLTEADFTVGNLAR